MSCCPDNFTVYNWFYGDLTTNAWCNYTQQNIIPLTMEWPLSSVGHFGSARHLSEFNRILTSVGQQELTSDLFGIFCILCYLIILGILQMVIFKAPSQFSQFCCPHSVMLLLNKFLSHTHITQHIQIMKYLKSYCGQNQLSKINSIKMHLGWR